MPDVSLLVADHRGDIDLPDEIRLRRLAEAGMEVDELDQLAEWTELGMWRFLEDHGEVGPPRMIRFRGPVTVLGEPTPSPGLDETDTWVELVPLNDGDTMLVPNDDRDALHASGFVVIRYESTLLAVESRSRIVVEERRYEDIELSDGNCTLRIFDNGDLDCLATGCAHNCGNDYGEVADGVRVFRCRC
jgi:hypothetical protein